MDDKGIIFTTDLLLALIVVTMAIGMTINLFDNLNYQIQDFTGRQSLDKTVNDAADYLVKSSGNPEYWEVSIDAKDLPGLTFLSGVSPSTNPATNLLDPQKISALNGTPGLISNLVHTTNYDLLITPADPSSTIDPIHISSPNPTTALSNAKEIAVANRTVVYPNIISPVQFNHLNHINPVHQSDTDAYIWYQQMNTNGQNGTTIYVGPGNVSTKDDNSSSFPIYPTDMANNNYYIYIHQNYALGGSPVNSIQYGFTEGDAVVGNATIFNINDQGRSQAIATELNLINSPGNWQNLKDTNPGSFTLVNTDIQAALTYYSINPVPNDTTITTNTTGDLKMWISVTSNPKAFVDVWLVKIPKTSPLSSFNVPAKLVLKIWE
jgi:hypothetical protein